jgi:ribosomal protein L29
MGKTTSKIKDMSIEDLEHFIEQKLLELFGDPDSGLTLKDDFKQKIQERLQKQSRKISHKELLKRFG